MLYKVFEIFRSSLSVDLYMGALIPQSHYRRVVKRMGVDSTRMFKFQVLYLLAQLFHLHFLNSMHICICDYLIGFLFCFVTMAIW